MGEGWYLTKHLAIACNYRLEDRIWNPAVVPVEALGCATSASDGYSYPPSIRTSRPAPYSPKQWLQGMRPRRFLCLSTFIGSAE
jgi:hypothetical protein